MSDARDIAIIILAIVSIIAGGLLVFLIIQIERLIRMLRQEIKPLLDSTNDTVNTVRGTTTFMSEHLVTPVVKVTSFLSGVRRMSQVIKEWPSRNGQKRDGEPTTDMGTDSSAFSQAEES